MNCSFRSPLVLSSRAFASLSSAWDNGMGFANCIITYDRSREGSVRTRAAWLTFVQILLADPSRTDPPALISFAKPFL